MRNRFVQVRNNQLSLFLLIDRLRGKGVVDYQDHPYPEVPFKSYVDILNEIKKKK